ncbi:MAG: LysR family transcriptional regulator [Gammaproteobacteria bacterium]|nr:LysR family transcriptional regulator [Gammaproteobacteria bacterium]
MKLHQLRYLVSVADNDLNITAAAKALHTSQPGVSKQLKMLEDELGFRIFVRAGRALVRVTPPGEKVISRARHIVREIGNIRGLAAELRKDQEGSLSIATTHTQARYVLPAVLKRFRQQFPGVRLHLHQGTSEQIAEMVARDRVDFVIATGGANTFPDLVRLPCYRWRRVIVVPAEHPLALVQAPSVAQLAEHPIITYSFSFTGPSSLLDVFAKAGETPNVALTAWDSDVIKEYIRAGLGVGILADVAVDPEQDADLRVRSAAHIFEPHTTWLGFRRGALLRSFMYEFMTMVAPHLTRRRVQAVEDSETQAAVDGEFAELTIPFRR